MALRNLLRRQRRASNGKADAKERSRGAPREGPASEYAPEVLSAGWHPDVEALRETRAQLRDDPASDPTERGER